MLCRVQLRASRLSWQHQELEGGGAARGEGVPATAGNATATHTLRPGHSVKPGLQPRGPAVRVLRLRGSTWPASLMPAVRLLMTKYPLVTVIPHRTRSPLARETPHTPLSSLSTAPSRVGWRVLGPLKAHTARCPAPNTHRLPARWGGAGGPVQPAPCVALTHRPRSPTLRSFWVCSPGAPPSTALWKAPCCPPPACPVHPGQAEHVSRALQVGHDERE